MGQIPASLSYSGPTGPNLLPSTQVGEEMFLLIIVSIMAAALVAEVFSLIGMAVTVTGAARRAMAMKKEVMDRARPSIFLVQELTQSLRPEVEKLRTDGAQIATTISARVRSVRAVWQDATRRAERLRFRLKRERVATVEQLQRDREVVSRGVLTPIRAAATVATGVRATAWLLRKVA